MSKMPHEEAMQNQFTFRAGPFTHSFNPQMTVPSNELDPRALSVPDQIRNLLDRLVGEHSAQLQQFGYSNQQLQIKLNHSNENLKQVTDALNSCERSLRHEQECHQITSQSLSHEFKELEVAETTIERLRDQVAVTLSSVDNYQRLAERLAHFVNEMQDEGDGKVSTNRNDILVVLNEVEVKTNRIMELENTIERERLKHENELSRVKTDFQERYHIQQKKYLALLQGHCGETDIDSSGPDSSGPEEDSDESDEPSSQGKPPAKKRKARHGLTQE